MSLLTYMKALRRKRDRERERDGGAGRTYEVKLQIPVGLEVVGVKVREVGR